MTFEPLGRFAEHASKPYPLDHLYDSGVLADHWQKHFAYELRNCPAAELGWTLNQTQTQIAALRKERDALKGNLLGWDRLTTKISKLQGKERAVTRLLERIEV